MLLFNSLMLALPVVFLIVSVIIAVKAFEKGKSRKKTVFKQALSHEICTRKRIRFSDI